jgi:cytochrome P450
MEAVMRKAAIELIEGMRLRGRCNFVPEFAEIFPLQIFMLLVDLPFADAPQLKKIVDGLLHQTGEFSFAEGQRRLYEYMAGKLETRIGGQGNDLLTRMANGQIDGRPISREEAISMSVVVLAAGLDTVASFISFALLFLARNPDRRTELIADPKLIPAAVAEFLRRYPVATAAREIRKDIEYCGVQMKHGDVIALPGSLAGLDEERNVRPMEVDFHRKGIEHSTFGNGAHHCAGAFLARAEVRIILEEWLARIPEFAVAPGAEITFSSGHTLMVDNLPLVWDPARTVAVNGP